MRCAQNWKQGPRYTEQEGENAACGSENTEAAARRTAGWLPESQPRATAAIGTLRRACSMRGYPLLARDQALPQAHSLHKSTLPTLHLDHVLVAVSAPSPFTLSHLLILPVGCPADCCLLPHLLPLRIPASQCLTRWFISSGQMQSLCSPHLALLPSRPISFILFFFF